MWILATVFLVSVGGVFCSDAECVETERKQCDTSALPMEFPQTPEKFEEDCRNVLTFFDCASEVLDKCGDDNEEGQTIRRVIFYVRRRICNPESHIYEAISGNLQCIETGVPKAHAICSGNSQDSSQKRMTDALEDYILEKLDTNEEFPDEHGKSCMEGIFSIACTTVLLGEECGIPVGDAYLDVANNLELAFSGCPEHVMNDLPVLVNTLRALVQVEEEVENAIRKKK